MKKKVEIVLQHFHGCPNGPKLIENLKKAVTGLEAQIDYHEQIIDTTELANLNNFRGSPTLLINGKDFEGIKAPENPNLSCRFYPKGLPTEAEIRKKIKSEL